MAKNVLISALLAILMAVSASAVDINWTNAGADRLWRNSANWSGGTVPTSADKAAIRNETILGPVIDSSTTAVANIVILSDWASRSDSITMTGGSLVTNYFVIGYYLQNNGTFTISAGTANILNYLYVGNGGRGTVTISGGSISINGLLSVAQQPGSTGTVNLDGGTVSTGTVNINSSGKINIKTGTLIVDGNQIAFLRSYEASRLLTAYNGGGKLNYEYNIANPGKTTVTASPPITITWDNGSGDNLWSTPANWNSNVVPDLSTGAMIYTSGASPIINSPMTANAFQVRVGASGSGAELTMNGGMLNVAEWLMVGTESASRTGTFTMNGGTVNLGCFTSTSGHFWMGFTGRGTFIMNDGTFNAPGILGLGWVGGAADLHLNGGTLFAGSLSMTSLCSIDITNGTLILNGDQTAIINTYKNSGWIKAFGGTGKLQYDYNITSQGKTTVKTKAAVLGDIDNDDDVDSDDLFLFANAWLDPNTANPANLNSLDRVDFQDFSLLASNWKKQVLTKWHVVTTQYPTDEFVITPFSASDFGIVGDGITDVTVPIQTALSSLSNLGGGTLYLPSGRYKITGNLTIPSRVCLRGQWQTPEIGTPISGTILQAYAGRGDPNAAPFIAMSNCSGVKGIAIWYPEQMPTDIRPYPPTFQRVSGNSQTLENITFVNPYIGFTTYNNSITGSPFLRNIYGTPLKTGIEFDCLAEVGRIETLHFSPDYWRYCGLPNSPTANEHAQWIYDNGTGILVRRIDWSYGAYATIQGYNIGLAIRPSLYDGVTSNGQFYAFDLLNCKTGIYVEDCSDAGMLLSRFNIQGVQFGVDLAATETGVVQMHTFDINSSDRAVRNQGGGTVLMQNCRFANTVTLNGGYAAIVNSDFTNAATTDIEIGSAVKGASIVGNRFTGVPLISNNTSYPVYIDSTQQNVSALPAYNYKKPDCDFKPAKSNLYVVTKYPYNAKGNGTNDDTAAFETALADAAANGGGTVFVPGGDYKLTRNLVIPAGVELRGVFEVPHTTAARGSVLNIYTGRGQENGTPFVQMQTGSGIRGLTFHYPQQIYDANDRVNYGFVPYPFLVRGLGANIYIINICATIPYQFIDLATYRCDNHYVDYVWSTALKTGIQVGQGCTDGQLQNCQFNPSSYNHSWQYYPSISPNAANDVHQYLWDRARPYVFGNMTGEVLHQNFVFGALYGVHFIRENDLGFSGYCLGMGMDQSTTSLRIDAVGSANLDMINTQLVTVDTVRGRYIETGSSFTGAARLFNTACWGNTDRSVVVNGGTLELQLFNDVKAGVVAYDVRGTGNLICIGGDVINLVSTLLLIEPTANATFTSNIFNTPESQMPVNSSNVTSTGNLRY